MAFFRQIGAEEAAEKKQDDLKAAAPAEHEALRHDSHTRRTHHDVLCVPVTYQ